MTTAARIIDRAHALGFDHAGIISAGPLPHRDALVRWIEAGHGGHMRFMARSGAARADPASLLDGVRSIIALAARHKNEGPLAGPGHVARYARGFDYHKILETRLADLAAFIEVETGAEVRTRAAVDRLPLLERDVAWLAGLGWIGKNTMVIHRISGSHLFLAELLVDADLEPSGAEPVDDFCGSCRACLTACPTDAFVGPYILDARRCISYLTIELRGPIPRALRPLIGDHLFGCDICQDVCPWNRKAPETDTFAFLGRPEIRGLSADQLLEMDEPTFRRRLALSPLQRAQRPGLLRNAAVVLGNTGDTRWSGLLARCLEEEPEPLIRGHVAWALGRLGGDLAARALEKRCAVEDDPYVSEELRQALETL